MLAVGCTFFFTFNHFYIGIQIYTNKQKKSQTFYPAASFWLFIISKSSIYIYNKPEKIIKQPVIIMFGPTMNQILQTFCPQYLNSLAKSIGPMAIFLTKTEKSTATGINSVSLSIKSDFFFYRFNAKKGRVIEREEQVFV